MTKKEHTEIFSTTQQEHKEITRSYFHKLQTNQWIEHGCDNCGGGMGKQIYDFQRKHRPQGTICSKCTKKETRKEMKKLLTQTN